MQGHMGAQEVVMGHEQSSKRDGTVRAIKAVRRFYVVFISSVKTLNELFKGSELFGLFIKVLKSYDLMMLDIRAINRDGVDEMDAGWIRGVPISNESDLLIRLSSADGLIHGDDGRLSASVICDVIGRNFEALGRDKEEDVIMLALDFDIGFITGAN